MNTRGVYAIYDRTRQADDRLDDVAAVLEAGVCWLQYRDKRPQGPDAALALSLRDLCRGAGVALIINDDWQLAREVDADGVHLGRSDGDIMGARSALGPGAIIGASCSQRLEYAEQAMAAGADYPSFGRFFDSRTKPDAPAAELAILGQARQRFDAPIVAIGGIDETNASRVIEAGADIIAVAGALFDAPDPAAATRALVTLFHQA